MEKNIPAPSEPRSATSAEEPDIDDDIDDDPYEPIQRPVEQNNKNDYASSSHWNASMDILSLAGLFFDYQVFGFTIERRVGRKFALGLKYNFGTFETNEGQPVSQRPIVRRNEIGGYLRYGFGDDVLGKGFYTKIWFQSAQEAWIASATFPGTTESGMVYGGSLGYQLLFKSVSIRLGYALQISTFESALEVAGVSYDRSSTLLSGLAHYAFVQVGFNF